MLVWRNDAESASSPVAGRLSRRCFVTFGLGLVGSALSGSVLAACANRLDDDVSADDDVTVAVDEDDETPERDDDGDSEVAGSDVITVEELIETWLEEFEPFDALELDLEQQAVEIQGETYDVRAYENTWVGEVTEDLFIAFSIDEEYLEAPGEIAAYACDSGDTSVYLTGELVDGEANLDDCVDKIELTLDDDEIAGTLMLEGGEPLSFVAVPSTGDAGLYRTESIQRGQIEFTPRWVVLEDGRQRGSFKCRNPWTGDCMQCPKPR